MFVKGKSDFFFKTSVTLNICIDHFEKLQFYIYIF